MSSNATNVELSGNSDATQSLLGTELTDGLISVRRQMLQHFFHSAYWHRVLSGLIVMDLVVVLTDIIIILLTCHQDTGGHDGDHDDHSVLDRVLHVLPVISIILLSIFEIELMLNIYAFGCKYLKRFLHLFDVIIVTITLILEIIFHYIIEDTDVEVIVSLTIILRLWRLVRVLHVTTEAIDVHNESKFHNYKDKIKQLTYELNMWKTGKYIYETHGEHHE